MRVGLPIDAVKKIRNEFLSLVYERQTLFRIQRRLMHNPHGRSYFIQERGWAGTNRMVNSQYLVHKFWKPSEGLSNLPVDHMFAINV